MQEVNVAAKAMIGLVSADVAGLLYGEKVFSGEVIVLNCTTVENTGFWGVANYNSSRVGSHYYSF